MCAFFLCGYGMAGKRAATKPDPEQPAEQPAEQPVEQPVEEEQVEEIVVDDDADAEDEDEDDLGSFDDDVMFDPLQQLHGLTQLLVTEAGVPVVDVLQGIQDSMDKQNKILYKLVSVIESRLK